MIVYSVLERELKMRLEASECVSFAYRKSDGSVRHARGTRNLSFIPMRLHPRHAEDPTAKVMNYYDYDRLEWRSFRLGTLLRIER